MIRSLSGAFVWLVLCVAPLLAAQDAETLPQFKKYFKQYKDTPTRVEAVLTLQGLEDPAVVEALVPVLKDPDSEVVRAAVRVLAAFKAKEPVAALFALLKNEKTEAVRIGVLRALADGKYADAAAAVVPCLADKSWEVKRRAVQVLVASGDTSQAGAIVPLCADSEPAVRSEALGALTSFKSELVVAPAIAALQDSIWQVRTTAIAALKNVRSAAAIAPLIERLAAEEGRLVLEIGETLASLTGKEFGDDVQKWRAYWEANQAGFSLPTVEAVAYLRGTREARTGSARPEFEKTTVTAYHGIDTPSRSIMFVIDVSGSMEALVTEKERFLAGKYPSFARIDIVKTELARTIDHLEPFVNFNILAFATKVDPWKKKLVPANVLNKSAARDWAGRLIAIGGASKSDLASVGLSGSANLELGKTNTYGALMAALNVTGGPRTGDIDYTIDVDTIFFLSDGRPTVGDFVDPDDILREVKAANELRKVVIHTIAIGEFQKDFMRRIAEENGGVFVDLGK
jgi:HEAT repeat protein